MATAQLINPKTFLEPDSLTLETLFQDDHFVVPDYQRDYSWSTQEAGELWNDLERTAKDAYPKLGASPSNPLPHFIGAIVLQRFHGSTQRYPEVMDGQQRLVTLSILISVLIEFARSIGDPAMQKNWTRTLEGAVYSHVGGTLVPRIRLARDHKYYEALYCECSSKSERDKYYSNLGNISKRSVLFRLKAVGDLFFDAIAHFLGSAGGPARDEHLVQLCKSILQLTVALRMSVLEQGVAYEVFETLNDRGLELQQADLLKSKLIALGEREGSRPRVVAAWARIVGAIEGQRLIPAADYSLTDFLFFHFVAVYGDIKKTELYKNVVRHLSQPGVAAIEYVEDAAKCAENLQQIYESGTTYAGVTRDIEAIRDVFPNKYATALLIAIARRFGPAHAETIEAIKFAHRFVFRRFLVESVELSTYASEITGVARDITAGKTADASAIAALLKAKSSDAQFQHLFREFSAPDAKIGFYVIEAIENFIAAGSGVVLQRQSPNQHLEHIMPKKLGSIWPHIDPALHSQYLNRIGNLLVLEAPINRRIKNKEFTFKDSNPFNEDYQHSTLKLPVSVGNYLDSNSREWTFGSIVSRQEAIAAKFAISVWQL